MGKRYESDETSWALEYLRETAEEKGLKVGWKSPTEICITIGTFPLQDHIYVTDDAPGEEDTSLELYVPAAHINTSGLTLQDVLDYLDDPIGKRDAVQLKNGDKSHKFETNKDTDMNKKSETAPTRKFGKKSEADAPFKVGDFVNYDAESDGKDVYDSFIPCEVVDVNDDGTLGLCVYGSYADEEGLGENASASCCSKLDHYAGMVDTDHYYMDGQFKAYKGGWEILITEKDLNPEIYEFIGTIDSLDDTVDIDDFYGGENFVFDEDLKDEVESNTGWDVETTTFADMSGDVVDAKGSPDESKKSEGLKDYIQYTNPDNGRTASLDPIKHPGLNKFIVYFGAGEKRYSSIKDAEDDLKSRGYEKDESKKSEATAFGAGMSKPKFVVGMMISLDGVKQYIRELKPRTFIGQSVDTGKEFSLPISSLNRASILYDPRNESKKSEATAFGAGMSKRKDFSKARNLGDVLEALEKHRDFLQAKAEDLTQSKEDLKASIAKLKEFSAHVDFLKQQSVKGIKDAISFNKSPEVKAAADVEQQLKDALKILYSDYSNIPDVTQLLTVLDSRYATTGDKVVTSWIDNANRAIAVDAKTVKDSIADGLLSEDDVVKLITVTSVQHGVKNKDTVEKVGPVLARMNALLETAPKLEEAVIDPKQFKELRDLVEQIVEEASAPKDIIKTTISSITKDELGKIKPLESKMVEGLLDKLKQMVSALGEKISALWDSFTSAFFGLEDEALESAEVFNEVEEILGYTGIQMESRIVKEETLGKKMEVLTKSVLTCCDKLVKDASLAGDFDDEVIYAEEAVKNAIESFQNLGEACKSLKSALSYHKNENNMDVIGILADAITQIVADDSGETEGEGEGSEEEDDSVVDQVEREYSPTGGPEHRELPSSEPVAAPNPAGAEEPEEF